MTVSKEQAAIITDEIRTAINEILTKHGLDANKVSSGYGEWYEFKFTASPVTLGLNGVNLTSKEAVYYTKFGFASYDYQKETRLEAPLGTMFTTSKGQKMVFAGIDSKRSKFPIVANEVGTGKTFFLTETVITKINESAKGA
jgi:hypothetical protein